MQDVEIPLHNITVMSQLWLGKRTYKRRPITPNNRWELASFISAQNKYDNYLPLIPTRLWQHILLGLDYSPKIRVVEGNRR